MPAGSSKAPQGVAAAAGSGSLPSSSPPQPASVAPQTRAQSRRRSGHGGGYRAAAAARRRRLLTAAFSNADLTYTDMGIYCSAWPGQRPRPTRSTPWRSRGGARSSRLLAGGERPVGDLVAALGIAQPQVSKHLRVLREVEVVQVRDEGRRRLYRLNGRALKPIHDWVQQLRAALDGALRAARRRVGRPQEGGRRWRCRLAERRWSRPRPTSRSSSRGSSTRPGHLVFRAYTEPDLVPRWWPGRRGEMQVCEIDLRPGGALALRDGRRGRLRRRLPRRVPRDRAGREGRLHGDLRDAGRHAQRGDAQHGDLHGGRRPHDARAAHGDARARTSAT